MIIVESIKEQKDFYEKWDNHSSIVIPIWCDLEKHPMNNEVSFLYILVDGSDYIINFNHIDAIKQNIDLSKSQQPKWVWNKKGLLQTNLNIQNIFDISNYTFFEKNKIIPNEVQSQPFISHYTRLGIRENLGKIAPLMKWSEYLKSFVEGLHLPKPTKSWVDDKTIPILSVIEQRGIQVDREKFLDRFPNSLKHLKENRIYTEYNPYIITSRPSNHHGGINFGALNKSDGTREVFIPKKDHIFLQFDYDAYHPRIIGKLIGYDLPKTSVHQWLSEQYGCGYDEGKGITFQILYGGVPDEFTEIPYFKGVKEFIDELWIKVRQNGYLSTQNRTIPLSSIEEPNAQKVFNYLLQSTETELNIEVLHKLKEEGVGVPILYQYDSFLFEYGVEESTERAKKIKKILEYYDFPVKASWGSDYSKV